MLCLGGIVLQSLMHLLPVVPIRRPSCFLCLGQSMNLLGGLFSICLLVRPALGAEYIVTKLLVFPAMTQKPIERNQALDSKP